MLGEKKSDIFSQIPSAFIPKTVLIKAGDWNHAHKEAAQIGYPLIAKPDIGERGRLVEKIHDQKALNEYVQKCPIDFLLQELVEFQTELGVFYVKLPTDSKGRVTSVVQKKYLSVIGDGRSTVQQLLQLNPRAQLQVNFKHDRLANILKTIPKEGQEMIIEPIGNHSRGTIFLDKTEEIDEKLISAIDQLARQIPEFYFGRFDILCKSFNDLRELKHFKIVELNGAGSEPGHIYDPAFSLLEGYKVVLQHFRMLYLISKQNKQRGFSYWSFKEGMDKLKTIKKHNRLIEPLI